MTGTIDLFVDGWEHFFHFPLPLLSFFFLLHILIEITFKQNST